jgi:uncharacterized protein YbjT (DUF2867 family)
MKITVVGASGRIGSKVVGALRAQGHDVVAASRSTGVNVLTGDGLDDALAGANALVDVTDSPILENGAAIEFFTTSAPTLVAAARRAGLSHLVLLSIVGVDRVPGSGYYRGKVAQERIIIESGIPYSIVRATQFAEFAAAITEYFTVGDEVRVPDALIQPIPADEVAAALARTAIGNPLNGIIDVGGPEKITFEQLARDALARKGDGTKTVVVDPKARYFGGALQKRSLVTRD